MQWFKHGLSTRVQLMTFMITLPETKPQNTKTAVAPKLIGICLNQRCNPSVLSLSCIINASRISMSDDL